MATRGIRNNNPCNIRRTKTRWLGQVDSEREKSFVVFSDRIYGYRATFKLLHNYLNQGVNTIGKIISRWAPSSDGNNTQSYIRHVSQTTGIDASTVIAWEERDKLIDIVRSMAHIESAIIEDRTILARGYDLANE